MAADTTNSNEEWANETYDDLTGHNTTFGEWRGSTASGFETSFNTSAGWSENDTESWFPKDSSIRSSQGLSGTEDTTLQSFQGTKEFPPLSKQFVTPETPGEDSKVHKDLKLLISSGIHQAKRAQVVSSELKHLLENEKKILDNVMKRCEKFSNLKEENKEETEKWFDDNLERLPKHEHNLMRLANCPDDCGTSDDEVAKSVRQKVLLEIVHKTIETVKGISVQLSMEDTIVNEIDLTLSDLRLHGLVMLKQISGWTRLLSLHQQHQQKVAERWEKIRDQVQQPRKKEKTGEIMSEKSALSVVRGFDDRLLKIEHALSDLAGKASNQNIQLY